MGRWYDNLDDRALMDAEQQLLGCCDESETKAVVVDLSATEFFGTSFLEVLFKAWSRMKKRGIRMVLAGLKGHPLEVVQVTRLDGLWELYDSVDSAVQALGGAKDS
jgi:anti-anti-sigma factor